MKYTFYIFLELLLHLKENFQIIFWRVIFWEIQAGRGTSQSPILMKFWHKFNDYKNRKFSNFCQNLLCRSRDMAIFISEWQLTKTKTSGKKHFWAQITSQSKKLPDICQWNHKLDMHINKNWWFKIGCVAVVANRAPPNITNIQPSRQVGHVGSAIFHCNMAAQIGSMA